jgi:hypothetical protein
MAQQGKSEGFVDYTYWLSESHRNPKVKARKPSRVLKSDDINPKLKNTASEPNKRHTHEPIINFDEKNGIVTNVEITCSCGEKLKLALEYDPDLVSTTSKSIS